MKKIITFCFLTVFVMAVCVGCKQSDSNDKQKDNKTTEQTATNRPDETTDDSAQDTNSSDTSMDATQVKSYDDILSGTHHAEIEIQDYGTVSVELDADTAPITVTNFAYLANIGFYDGLTFHRIINGFMIQGGDPNGDGTGGSDHEIKGEFKENGVENSISHKRGVISMARSTQYDSASSQFFIMHQDGDYLDGSYAAFGKVTEGMEVVDKIATEVPVIDGNGTVESQNQPVITTVRMID